ncbi:MAG: hypothetical protein KH050_08570 [Clostridiaceae bacterium]|nr:hypothetical protein [Clostridiaceae bacterium]
MKNTKEIRNRCPCCGKTDLEEYEICSVCGWENDLNQLRNESLRGANEMTLAEARKAYSAKIKMQ